MLSRLIAEVAHEFKKVKKFLFSQHSHVIVQYSELSFFPATAVS